MTEHPPPEKVSSTSSEMGILDHLAELRTRLIKIFAAVFICGVGAFYYADIFFFWLRKPFTDAFPNEELIGSGPAEAFTLKITVSLFAGLLLSLPFIFYQLWCFIAPGLHENERKLAAPFIVITSLCFMMGVIFCYYGVLPFSFSFFHDEYASIGLAPQITMSSHLSLVVQALFAFGIIFEFPVLAFILGRLGILTSSMLVGSFRYVVLGIFIASAILTPPDVVSQLLMAGPMMILYGISVLVLRAAERKSQ